MTLLFPNYEQILAVMGRSRHKDWPERSRLHIARNPRCLVCGSTENVQVHHNYPFHRFPELEMDESEWSTLCIGGPINCHFLAGHAGKSWSHYSPNIAQAVELVRSGVKLLKLGAE